MSLAPLRIQTRYSPWLSIIEPGALAGALRRAGYDAAGITDRGVLFGAAEARASCEAEGIALAAGAEVVVRFGRPGGGFPPPAYALTIFPESPAGARALSRLLDRIWRDDRPERLRGVAEWIEVDEGADEWIVLSGGLAGPVSGAFARGRVGDARRLAATLAGRFGPSRFFLEVTRAGGERESLADAFLRETAERHGLRRVAGDPVRYLDPDDRELWRWVRGGDRVATVEDPADPFVDELAAHLPRADEWARRYQQEPEALDAAAEIAERCRAAGTHEPIPGGGPETDELIRVGVDRMKRRYGHRAHGVRKEIETRFWSEFWRIEKRGWHGFALRLGRIFETLRRADADARITTPFLAGSLLGYLLDLQAVDPIDESLVVDLGPAAGPRSVRIEADSETASRFRRLIQERHAGEIRHPLLACSPEETEPGSDSTNRLPLPGEESGPEPHPPTASPSGRTDRGNRGPDPLREERLRTLFARVVAGYRRDRRTLLWADDPARLWDTRLVSTGATEGAVRLEIAPSSILDTLRATASIPEGGDPWGPIRKRALVGLGRLGAGIPRALMKALEPASIDDLALILATADRPETRTDLFDRIAEVRAGARQAPFRLPRTGASLAKTEGIPFFREQLLEIVRHFTGFPEARAEAILDGIARQDASGLARERALFLRRAADRGVSEAMASKFFSLLLALAHDAPSRAPYREVAERIAAAAARKSADPVAFAAGAMNGVLADVRRARRLAAGFRREGIGFLPLDRNRSVYRFRPEGGRVRVGLGVIKGMTGDRAALFEQEREVRGPFVSGADLLERLAARRFPRPLLLEVARVFAEDGTVAPWSVDRSEAREGESRIVAPETRGARPLEGKKEKSHRAPRPRRSRRGGSQTSFPFIEKTATLGRDAGGAGHRFERTGEGR